MRDDQTAGSNSHSGDAAGVVEGEERQEVVVNQMGMDDVPLTAPIAGPSRVEADPLPSKRGEIGFREPEHVPDTSNSQPEVALPARHPADRDAPPANADASPDSSTAATNNSDTASMRTNNSVAKSILSKLKPKKDPTIRGIRSSSILIFVAQILIFIGTIAGWALLTNHLSHSNKPADTPGVGISTTQIFLHVVFAIASLAQLVFVERSIYHMRAQRWAHIHGPGLPMHGSRGERPTSAMGIGFAPWNRPPLPTYAAALAQSGVGTGDVEDSAIAMPPPPEYGNTRGSQLLLSGMLTDSMREQRAQARAQAIARANAGETGSVRGSWASERPLSYVSRDEEWEERRDAGRAVILEQTLARLDTGRPTA